MILCFSLQYFFFDNRSWVQGSSQTRLLAVLHFNEKGILDFDRFLKDGNIVVKAGIPEFFNGKNRRQCNKCTTKIG